MAHALEQGANGETSFAERKRTAPAWHGLGTVFDTDAEINTAQMLEMAHLNGWNVRLEKVTFPDNYTVAKDAYAVVRNHPYNQNPDVLATVGERYKVVQNEELFAFGDGILDGGAQWETAGSIKDGRVVFGSLVVPKEFIIDPNGIADKTVTYLLMHTSHDGSTSLQANITPVRVVCQNTLNMALKDTVQSFKVKHTQTISGRMEEARRVLGLTFDHMTHFEDLAKSLFETEITNAQFDKLVANLYPAKDDADKMANTKYQQKIDTIQNLYRVSSTQDGIRGTKWGALNALTERVDYFRTARTGNDESLMANASGLSTSTGAEKARILSAVMAL
jgi:phage/plasmid-like protein (TIGR03299 family)